MKKTLLALCALCLATLHTSCGNSIQINIGLELVSLDRGEGSAVVRFVNPTIVAYNLANSKHQVWLDGRSAGVIEIDTPIGLAAEQSYEQKGKFIAEKGANLPAGTAHYRLESRVTVTLWGDQTQTNKLAANGTVLVK